MMARKALTPHPSPADAGEGKNSLAMGPLLLLMALLV